jgi:hypothetical protein
MRRKRWMMKRKWTRRRREREREDDQLIRHSACVAVDVVLVVAVVVAAAVRAVAGECWVQGPVDAVVDFALPVLDFDFDPGLLWDDDVVAVALVVSAAAGGRSLGGKAYSHSRMGRAVLRLGTVLERVDAYYYRVLSSDLTP